MRETPEKYLTYTCQLFRNRGCESVVEIGMVRREDYAHKTMDGYSTKYWIDVAKRVWTTDIDPKACELTRRLFGEYSNLFVYNKDGIEFMETFPPNPIDLLYLDAMQGGEVEAPGFHLKIYQIARDRGLLTDKAMVLIDDTDLHNGGKGKLVIPEAEKDGFRKILTGRQTLLVKE